MRRKPTVTPLQILLINYLVNEQTHAAFLYVTVNGNCYRLLKRRMVPKITITRMKDTNEMRADAYTQLANNRALTLYNSKDAPVNPMELRALVLALARQDLIEIGVRRLEENIA